MRNSIKAVLISIVLLACALVACTAPLSSNTSTPTQPSAQPTSLLPANTPTALPTATPTTLPTATPTPLFQISGPINATNVTNLKQLARLGLGQHTAHVWSPDSRFAALGSGAGVWVLNAADGALLFSDFAGNVQALTFSADSQRLAIATDRQVIVYNLPTGERQSSLNLDFFANDLAFRTTTLELVITGAQKDVFGNTTAQIIARALDGKLLDQRSLDIKTVIGDLSLAEDGSALMNYSQARHQYEFFNLNGQRIGSLPQKSSSSMAKGFNAGLFAVCLFDEKYAAGPVKVYRTNGQLIATLTIKTNVIQRLEISADGRGLNVMLNGTIQQYSLPQGALLATIDQRGDGLPSPDFQRAFDGSQLRDLATGQKLGEAIELSAHAAEAIAISADHSRLVVCYPGSDPQGDYQDLWAEVIDTRSLQRERSFTLLPSGSSSSDDVGLFTLLADGETLAWHAAGEGEVQFWSVVSGKQIDSFKLGFPAQVAGVSPDGQYVLAADKDGNVEIGERSTATRLVKMSGVKQYIGPYDTVFSLDGQNAALSGSDILLIWDLPGGKEVKLKSNGHIVISPDGRWLMQRLGNDQKFALYDLPTRKQAAAWPFVGPADRLAFSPNGEVLIVRGLNQLDFLAPLSGEVLRTLDYSALDMVMSADGYLLVTTSYDGTVRLWGIP